MATAHFNAAAAEDSIPHKACCTCKQNKPLTEYHRKHDSKDGHCARCKACAIRLATEWAASNREAYLARLQRWSKKNKETRDAYARQYYAANADHIKAATQKHRQDNRDEYLQRQRAYYQKVKERDRDARRARSYEDRIKIKMDVLGYYSKQTYECACCGIPYIEFLTIDHINGDGAEHRKTVTNLYGWLRKHGYPEGFRVLCINCNFAFGKFGYCPHQLSELKDGNTESP